MAILHQIFTIMNIRLIIIFYIFTVEFIYTRDQRRCADADRDPQNIWNPQKNCRTFKDDTSLEPLPIRPTLVFSTIQYMIAFPLTPKHVIWNDPEWPFCVKFCFVSVCLEL